ncbi:MAG: circadian clock KaiB family protein [Magnetococcales bacterium]|nr:circadian clock KaiB family protein [Magnetococcales bacterium]
MNDVGLYQFRLYVVGDTPSGQRARDNFKRIQEYLLPDEVQLEVVDILKAPERAEVDRIIAVPTLVRVAPPPAFKIIGDLSDSAHLRTFFAIAEEGKDKLSVQL